MSQPSNLDLSLPAYAPEMVQHYPSVTVRSAAFAIYSLVPGMTEARLEEFADLLNRRYMRSQKLDAEDEEDEDEVADEDDGIVPLVRLAQPTALFGGKTLKDVLAAHVAMDKERQSVVNEDGDEKADDEGIGADTIGIVDVAFLVVTKDGIDDTHSLLVVYVDTSKGGLFPEYDDEGNVVERGPEMEEELKREQGKLDKFFVEPRFASSVLTPFITDGQEIYDGRQGLDVDEDDYDPSIWEDDQEEEGDEA